MKSLITPLIFSGVLALSAMPADAGLLDDLKAKAKKKATQEAAKSLEIKNGGQSTNAQKSNSKAGQKTTAGTAAATASVSLAGGPDKSLVAMVKCSGVKIDNVMTGYYDDYQFQQGFSTETRRGLVRRAQGEVSNGCILPSLESRQYAYFEVDTTAYDESRGDMTMQCVRSENPSAGVVTQNEGKAESPYKVDNLNGKDILLHCGHSEALADSCAEGSNSARSSEWKKDLNARGKTMMTVYGRQSHLAPAEGEKLFCQYYNKKTYKAMFAFEYIRKK